jgi:hypothetical protein
MSYNVKYKVPFKSGDYDCEVRFKFKAYNGTTFDVLNAGPRAFVLREYNTDLDFFKPLRPMQAEIEILATPSIRMEDFLANNDDEVLVEFWFNGQKFWTGFVMQDDFQEPWIDTAHLFTLRATDGLGTIDQQDDPTFTGRNYMTDYVTQCIDGAALQNHYYDYGFYVICNLFYQGMIDKSSSGTYETALTQAQVDKETFRGFNRKEIVEKINKAWSMTLFQYMGSWWWIRMEEYLNDNPLKGSVYQTGLDTGGFTKTFDVPIGVGETIKPITPYMLRSVNRPSKWDKITFFYKFPEQPLCNQDFTDGGITSDTPTEKKYSINCWSLLKSSLGSPTGGTLTWYRRELYDADGNMTDNYAIIESGLTGNFHYMKSGGIVVGAQNTVNISFSTSDPFALTTSNGNKTVAYVLFETATQKYTLDDDGAWALSNSSYTTNVKSLHLSWSSAESFKDWKELNVKSNPTPGQGTMYICLVNMDLSTQAMNQAFKDLQFTLKEQTSTAQVVGDYDQYTLSPVINKTFEEEICMDDSNNLLHLGSLTHLGNLTGDNWYRTDFSTERLTFKRHKAIAHMLYNRRVRQRLEVNMTGLTWVDGAMVKPIGLMNRFIFTDDAPGKVFMILNLNELDFSKNTWKAQLVEIWDDADDKNPANYPPHSFANIYQKDV